MTIDIYDIINILIIIYEVIVWIIIFPEYYLYGSKSMFKKGYNCHIKGDYDNMKKYYWKAINMGNEKAMYNLGLYYQKTEINYDEMKYCYLLAINKGFANAMHNLAIYYQNTELNYDEMKKYYLMAVNKGYQDSMINLCDYLAYDENNFLELNKYYDILIKCDLKDKSAKDNLKKIEKKLLFEKIKIIFYEKDNDKIKTLFKNHENRYKCRCFICYSKDEKYYIDLQCGQNNEKYNHLYCNDCFAEWFLKKDNRCVYCNNEFEINKCIYIENIIKNKTGCTTTSSMS